MARTTDDARRRRRSTGALAAAALFGGALATPTTAALAQTVETARSVDAYSVAAPSDVQKVLGSFTSGVHVCGTSGGWYEAALEQLGTTYDDPEDFARDGAITEGNYPNTQMWSFTPRTSLVPGDDITVSFPAPPQPYSPSGASFPAQSLTLAQGIATATTVLAPSTQVNEVGVDVVVTVKDAAGAAVVGKRVTLLSRNPAAPDDDTADAVLVGTSLFSGSATGATGTDGKATFTVGKVSDARRVFLASVEGTKVVDTATTTFGTVDEAKVSGPCDAEEGYAPAAGEAPPWFIAYRTATHGWVAEEVSVVEVSRASGQVTAEVSSPEGIMAGTSAVLVAVGAVSPPAGPEYPREAFPLRTPRDPLPAAPVTAPTYKAQLPFDLGRSTVVPTGQRCAVDTWCAEASTTEATTVTVTARDLYDNPVSGASVVLRGSVPESGNAPTHARIVPDDPASSGRPRTKADGTASFSVGDSCAEDVRVRAGLESVDAFFGTVFDDAVVRFLPSAPLPPSAPTSHSDCGVPATTSRILVDATVQGAGSQVVRWPGDGQTPLPVAVSLADVHGNAVGGESVLLADAVAGASVDPAPGSPSCSTGSACTRPDGVAGFQVRGDATDGVTRSVLTVTAVDSGVVFPTDPRTHPQDVAQVDFLPVDPGRSSVVASSTTSAADGQPNTLVTVRLVTADGHPMRGRPVSLSSGSSTFSAACEDAASPGCRTDANGEARFLVANTQAEQVLVTARSVVEGVALAPLTLTYKRGGASLLLAPASAVADGAATSTVRYTLTDLDGRPVEGAAVTLTTADGDTVRAQTDADGRAVALAADGTRLAEAPTVTRTTPGVVTYSALATYTPTAPASCPGRTEGTTCTVTTSPAAVTWTPAPASFTYDVAPAQLPADGRSTATVVVTALDAAGTPVPRLSLRLDADDDSGPLPQPAQALTGGDGRATFTVKSSEHGVFGYRAAYLSNAWTGVGTASAALEFLRTQLSSSTLTVLDGSSPAPADGDTAVQVRVTMQTDCSTSGSCRPLSDTPVVLETGSATTRVTSPSSSGTTDADGAIDFAITSSQAQALQVYARDVSRNVRIGPLPVEFLPTEGDVSTVTASPDQVEAGGAGSTITVTLLDHLRRPLAGRLVALSTSSSAARVVPVEDGTTTADGTARFTLTSTRIEDVVVRATDTTNGVRLTDTAVVRFVGSEANRSAVRAALGEVMAGGPGTTLTVTLRDGDGNPLVGRGVDVLGASPSTTVQPLLSGGVTDSSGVAEFGIASSAVETVTFSARDRTNGVLVQQTATVVFAAHEANQSSVAGPGAVAAIGPPGTVTVTLRDRAGAPLVGHTVSLLDDSSTAVSSPAATATDGAGRAVFQVSDDVVEPVVFSALDRSTGVTVQQTATVDFFPDEANRSTATASPPDQKVRRDTTITVTLRDAAGQPLAGHGVRLDTGSGTAKVTAVRTPAVTDADGVLRFTVTDRNPGRLDIAVTDTTTGVRLYRPVVVHFYK